MGKKEKIKKLQQQFNNADVKMGELFSELQLIRRGLRRLSKDGYIPNECPECDTLMHVVCRNPFCGSCESTSRHNARQTSHVDAIKTFAPDDESEQFGVLNSEWRDACKADDDCDCCGCCWQPDCVECSDLYKDHVYQNILKVGKRAQVTWDKHSEMLRSALSDDKGN